MNNSAQKSSESNETNQTPQEEPLPTAPESLLERLDSLGISYELHHHEAVFTVEESRKVDAQIPGTHCRNLFLRDKKKKMHLVVLPNDYNVDMKKLQPVIGSDRLSFGSPDRLWTYLGVRPGSVCPFSVINDTEGAVQVILEESMMQAKTVNYHPLLNTMTVSLSPQDLLVFLRDCNHEPKILDLSGARPE